MLTYVKLNILDVVSQTTKTVDKDFITLELTQSRVQRPLIDIFRLRDKTGYQFYMKLT